MHAVNSEIIGDGSHGGRERLGDGGAAVDASGPGRMPERASVGEYILLGYEPTSVICDLEDRRDAADLRGRCR